MYSIVFQVAEIQNQHLEDWEENLYDPQSESNEEAEQASGMDKESSSLVTQEPKETSTTTTGDTSSTDAVPNSTTPSQESSSSATPPPVANSSQSATLPEAKHEAWNPDLIGELIEAVEKETAAPGEEPDTQMDPTKLGKISFFSGNPVVELAKGEIHLFKQADCKEIVRLKSLPSQRTKMIVVLAIPSWMSLADFYSFCGAYTSSIERMRILSDSSPNRYMVVMRFKRQKEADEFYKNYNGKSFSSLAPEVCYLGFVRRVRFFHSGSGSPASKVMFPEDCQVELPTCPVCLERLDSTESGIVTILCQHSFHCKCLVRWRDENSCPVCRYMQTPTGKETRCNKCGTTEGLWICLVCGHVGCSRYKDLHAFEHYKQTKHNYALELETQRVWDYAGDGYVHRLIQNKTDGKLVEVPSRHQSTDDRSGSVAAVPDGEYDKEWVGKSDMTKAEAISLEYQYLLTAQLETQRAYFEEQMQMIEKQKEYKIKTLEQQKNQLIEHVSQLIKRVKQLELEKEALVKDNKSQRVLIAQLEEQLKDLMFYIEAQKAIAEQPSELKDGSIVVVPNPERRASQEKSPGGSNRKRIRSKK